MHTKRQHSIFVSTLVQPAPVQRTSPTGDFTLAISQAPDSQLQVTAQVYGQQVQSQRNATTALLSIKNSDPTQPKLIGNSMLRFSDMVGVKVG